MENKCKFIPRGQLLPVVVVFCSVLTTVHRNQKIYASFLQRNCFINQAVFLNFVHFLFREFLTLNLTLTFAVNATLNLLMSPRK